MVKLFTGKIATVLTAVTLITGCDELALNPFLSPAPGRPASEMDMAGLVERDVEAPGAFSAAEAGLWDGRPLLGGVWVSHPEVSQPERVIIRNEDNGSFVIGSLIQRDRGVPGPRIQVSSDAAAELDMQAGIPAALNIVALRREQIPIAPIVEEAPTEPTPEGAIEATALDPVPPSPPAAPTASAAAEAPATVAAAAPITPQRPASSLDRPFIQIGIFSIEQNANNTGTSLRNIGIIPTILRQESQGKVFWRVIVGPATSAAERRVILRKVRELGFDDAYFVTN
ncbi:MAG: SPOR domain-containing protein [Rhodobacteraceae bacterium]|nr:SPOR domain-containing protein [Alphaproteobacteria bacterium]MBT8475418.1 SPOR domain-containing protein [Alphaproteobacteria bacterium]NNK68378.1 SPOR domain-containing protein [Paracoccaceae bacterium]